ncbi:MAG: hypothetical protein AUJ57_03790 [Zetaproteobacteria bacterium CG1_02_53_45]|nr:MAG: hypothetical protein AUJ57_03790 [Zetaproteobacteria bacterium CG1_02_53_45]
MLNTIEALGAQAAGMIRQMLTYVGHSEVVLRPQKPGGFFREAVAGGEAMVPPGVVLIREIPDLPDIVEADTARLHKVAEHLISNACDALKAVEQGEVRVA